MTYCNTDRSDPGGARRNETSVPEAQLRPYFAQLRHGPAWRWCGKVLEATAQTVEAAGPLCSVGECCEILDSDNVRHSAEVIGFRGPNVLVMPLDATTGIRYGDRVLATGIGPSMALSEHMEGRILDALGAPIDDLPPLKITTPWSLNSTMPRAMERVPIVQALQTGVRVIDAMLTVGARPARGHLRRVGSRQEHADRHDDPQHRGRHHRGWVGGRARPRGARVCRRLAGRGRPEAFHRIGVDLRSESPAPDAAAAAATTVAEFHAARGKHVLLVLDSLTRYAMAAREVGLAAGEPPATKGYTPSVFAHLAKLVERAGNFRCGSITAFYTVLMEGDDQQDPIVDAARSLLDGHVVLSREMASEGWFPPVNLLDSVSRLMPAIITPEHREQATTVRRLLALHARSADLVRIGAYKPGMDAELDRSMRAMPALRSFLEQRTEESVSFEQSVAQFQRLEL